jgi:hypothetical protein
MKRELAFMFGGVAVQMLALAAFTLGSHSEGAILKTLVVIASSIITGSTLVAWNKGGSWLAVLTHAAAMAIGYLVAFQVLAWLHVVSPIIQSRQDIESTFFVGCFLFLGYVVLGAIFHLLLRQRQRIPSE